jgi:adenosylcobinamide-phosphate synthase
VLLAWTCLAARSLQQEARAVSDALERRELSLARARLARVVGRDTHSLPAEEISRALIETLAESASDGVVAPMLSLAVGGVPLAMAYKAINTLDSMIGHRDQRYLFFGKAAARLDDAANYVPARVTALAVIATSVISEEADPHTAWHIWRRDGGKHKSPNAGQPEAAMSGALRVRLGGDNHYDGELIPAPVIGEQFSAPSPAKARRAIALTSGVCLVGLGVCMALACMHTRRPSK